MNSFKIDFWDVGQGDCSVITLPSEELIIIDTGGDPCIQKWLKRRNPSIHAIVITHNDKDHCGCLNGILRDYNGPRPINLWIVNDQHRGSKELNELFSSVLRHAENGKVTVSNIVLQGNSPRQQIYQGDHPLPSGNVDIKLDAVFPRASNLVGIMGQNSPNPNRVSAILKLSVNGSLQIVWAGDAPMSAVAAACQGDKPKVLVGPHHGGPIDRHEPNYRECFNKLTPERVFVSVGTQNSYNHPLKLEFTDLHLRRGHKVVCSQMKHCGKLHQETRRPLIGNHLVIGLEPPSSGVSCRGPMRLTWNGSLWDDDIFQKKHFAEIQKLDKALCLK